LDVKSAWFVETTRFSTAVAVKMKRFDDGGDDGDDENDESDEGGGEDVKLSPASC